MLRELIADGAAPPPRALHTATLLGDVLYVMGGVGPHDRPLHDVHALDTLQWRWSQPPISGRPPALLSRHSATALNGALYVFGGCAPGRAASATADRRSAASGKLKYSSQLHTLGPARDAVSGAPVLTSSSGCPPLVWHAVEVVGKPPAPRGDHSAAAAAGLLFVHGGQKLTPRRNGGPPAARASNELWVFQPETAAWSQVARVPPLRREAASLIAVSDTFLLAFGGWTGGGGGGGGLGSDSKLPWSRALHALHLPTMRWFELAAPGAAPGPRYGHAAAIVDGAATDPKRCTLQGEGLAAAIAGAPASVIIVARDATGGRRWSGGDRFAVRLRGTGPLSGAVVDATVEDHADGRYTARYVAGQAGDYVVCVELIEARSKPLLLPEGTTGRVRVTAGPPHALEAELTASWATAGEVFSSLRVRAIDAHGNALAGVPLAPQLTVVKTAALGSLAADAAAAAPAAAPAAAAGRERAPIGVAGVRALAAPRCDCQLLQVDAGAAEAEGGDAWTTLRLRLSGAAALVTLRLSQLGAPVPSSLAAAASPPPLQPTEVLVRLAGPAVRLVAAEVGSCLSGSRFGPLRVCAADATGNSRGGVSFEPRVSARRVDGGDDGSVAVEVCELGWERSARGEAEVALLWLKLRGSPGEVELKVLDGTGAVGGAATVGLYMAGPPYFLRASCDPEVAAVAGEDYGPIIVRLVDRHGKIVSGLSFSPELLVTPPPGAPPLPPPPPLSPGAATAAGSDAARLAADVAMGFQADAADGGRARRSAVR